VASETKYYTVYFAPDLDNWWNVNPGMLLDITDLVPTRRGSYKTYQAGAAQNISNGAFDEATYGITLTGEILKRTDGTARMLAGTTTRLMECTGSAWVDVSLGGANYSTAENWSFTTFGDHVIACSKANNPQLSTAKADVFADLGGGPPKASVCTTQRNFVILGDCNDGSNDLGDQVWWSALGNDASWTASASTQAGNLRLRDTPGKITALVNMRDAVAVYKEDSLYLLDYQGSPLLWTARLISDKVGCAGMHGIAVVNGIHYFLHRTGLHRFDGASVTNIGMPVYRYLFDKMGSQTNYATVQAAYDEYEGLVFFYFHDAAAASNERRYALVYHQDAEKYGFVKNAWNAGTGTCRCVMKATLSDLTAWNSGQATQSANVVTLGNVTDTGVVTRRAVFGSSASASFRTGNIGNNVDYAMLSQFRLRCDTLTMSGATVDWNNYNGVSGQATYVANTATQWWNGSKSARYFIITVPMAGLGEVNGIYVTTTKAGTQP
jgi:hypothetical protein